MSTRAIADLQESIDALRAALAEGDWESCQLELDTGERMWMSREEAVTAVREGDAEIVKLRQGLN